MATRDDVIKAIADYETHFRRDDVEKLQPSGVYALFPNRVPHGVTLAGRWDRDSWPHAARSGVYLFFDDDLQLLYVGKTSWGNSLGGRLYNYFREAPTDHSCRIRHDGWSRAPAYVMTVAVPRNMTFEASALEEYLIGLLRPPDNTVGIRPCD